MITAIFFVAALVALAGAVGIVLFRKPIASVLSLVLMMFALSVLFLLLSAQFLFAVQLIVYGGAVMVLFLFVIALLGPVRELASTRLPRQSALALISAGSSSPRRRRESSSERTEFGRNAQLIADRYQPAAAELREEEQDFK